MVMQVLTLLIFAALHAASHGLREVHIVQSCHLDVGFALPAYQEVNKWFHHHIPAMISVHNELNMLGNPWNSSLNFMGHSWLFDLYLNCPPGFNFDCPDRSQLEAFQSAVASGIITWHAFPFNSELQLHSAGLLATAIAFTHSLDNAFNLPPKAVISQRDVPGTTRAIIPVLRAAGVIAMDIGCNSNAAPPVVPRIFIWLGPDDGTDAHAALRARARAAYNASHASSIVGEGAGSDVAALAAEAYTPAGLDTLPPNAIIGALHRGGYGGTAMSDAIVIPGCPHAVVPAWRGDNLGPGEASEYVDNFHLYRGMFGEGVGIYSSSFDAFYKAVITSPECMRALPLVDSEVGENWVYGAQSDPLRAASLQSLGRVVPMAVREARRAVAKDVSPVGEVAGRRVRRVGLGVPRTLSPSGGTDSADDDDVRNTYMAAVDALALPRFGAADADGAVGDDGARGTVSATPTYSLLRNFTRFGLKGGEHTWGGDVKLILTNNSAWSNVAFNEARDPALNATLAKEFRDMEWTWWEQREWSVDVPLRLARAGAAALPSLSQYVEDIGEFGGGGVGPFRLPGAPGQPWKQVQISGQQPLKFGNTRGAFEINKLTGGIATLWVPRKDFDADVVTTQRRFAPVSHLHTRFNTSISASDASGSGGMYESSSFDDDNLVEIPCNNLFGVAYQTYSAADYEKFFSEYFYASPPAWWATHDYGKPGPAVGSVENVSKTIFTTPVLTTVYESLATESDGVMGVYVESAFDNDVAQGAGAPAKVGVLYTLPKGSGEPSGGVLGVEVFVLGKTATRLPEALWVAILPAASSAVEVLKTGSWVGVEEGMVVVNGSIAMHGGAGARIQVPHLDEKGTHRLSAQKKAKTRTLSVMTHDTEVMALGSPPYALPLRLQHVPSPPADGSPYAWSLLSGNTWGTNYPMWYPYHRDSKPVEGMDIWRARFELSYFEL